MLSNEELRNKAVSMGFTIDDSRIRESGSRFIKDTWHIWKIPRVSEKTGDFKYQCAELINGRFTNHAPQDDLLSALEYVNKQGK